MHGHSSLDVFPGCGGSRGAHPAMAPIEFDYRVWPPLQRKNSSGKQDYTSLAPLCQIGTLHGPSLIERERAPKRVTRGNKQKRSSSNFAGRKIFLGKFVPPLPEFLIR